MTKTELMQQIIQKHTDILADIVLQLGHIAGTEWVKNRMDELKELASLKSQLSEAGEEKDSQLVIDLKEKIKKLEFMIENGLGWEDMRNDITMPHEI